MKELHYCTISYIEGSECFDVHEPDSVKLSVDGFACYFYDVHSLCFVNAIIDYYRLKFDYDIEKVMFTIPTNDLIICNVYEFDKVVPVDTIPLGDLKKVFKHVANDSDKFTYPSLLAILNMLLNNRLQKKQFESTFSTIDYDSLDLPFYGL